MKGRPTNSIRKLSRVGGSNSLAVIIPAELLRSLGWKERQRVQIKKLSGSIVIRDAKTKKRKKK